MQEAEDLVCQEILEAKAGPMAASQAGLTETTALSRITNSDESERLMVTRSATSKTSTRDGAVEGNRDRRQVYHRRDRCMGRTSPMRGEGPRPQGLCTRTCTGGTGVDAPSYRSTANTIEFVVSPLMTQIYALLPSDVSGASEASELDAQGSQLRAGASLMSRPQNCATLNHENRLQRPNERFTRTTPPSACSACDSGKLRPHPSYCVEPPSIE